MFVPGAAGALAGLVAVAGLLAEDVGRLRQLILGSESPWLPVLILSVSFMVTFGSAAIGAAVMGLRDED